MRKFKILLLDNYDSFTYNLAHIIKELGYSANLEVYRNDKIKLADIKKYNKILLSPGPGLPDSAGIMLELISKYQQSKDILGICLGHQAICQVHGAKLINMSEVTHGLSLKTIVVKPKNHLFTKLPAEFMTGRYHSWVVDSNSLPKNFEITALSDNNLIMGVSHKKYQLAGLQFHPESILTEYGKSIIANWLKN